MVICVCAALFIWQAALARAAWQEGFESPTKSWQPAKADLAYGVTRHERVTGTPHTGQVAEYVQIDAADGTYVYFSHDVPPARIVAELVPSVWVKAERPGIQILARVVLPQFNDPRTGQPLTTLIRGSTYSQPGQWQQLRIADTPKLLSRQAHVLRAQIGPQVDSREAYIDQVWLNVYSGPGLNTAVIDDLEVAGLVPRTPMVQQAGGLDAAADSSANVDGSAASPRKVSLNGTILHVDGRPFFPRIIQSQGEPLAWLKELGFNAVRVDVPPTLELLDEARRLGMWVIAPPPEGGWQSPGELSAGRDQVVLQHGQTSLARGTPEIGPMYDGVLAWHLGTGLAARELPSIAAMSKQLRQADRRVDRPLVCNAEEDLFNYSSHVQVLSAHRFPLGSGLELVDYGSWLKERPRLARPGKPLWTTIQTEPSPALVAQAAALGGANAAEPTIDAGALRLLAYQAFASGVRGLEFASSSRLDAGDNTTRIRALSLALLNLELELLEPWGAAGTMPLPISSRDPNLRGVVIGADQTRLVVAMRSPKGSQFVAQPAAMQAAGAAFVVTGVPESHDAYELTLAGVRRLRHDRISGGTSIAIEDFPLTALVLIISDPLVHQAMTRRVEQLTPRAARLQRELAVAMLAETEAVERRLAGSAQLPPAAASLNAARTALTRADQLLAAGDNGNAYFAARNATVSPARWRREVWNRTAFSLGPAVASPLAASFTTLPDHLNFAASLAGVPMAENLLVGGEFEDLQTMLGAGWRNYEHPQQEIKTTVELSPQAPFADRFCLRLQALPENAEAPPALVESPPLWVTSAPVQVDAGDVVCIRGQARVTGKVSGSVDGLMVIDSLGGEALAERIDATNGWREFVMYRAAAERGNVTVTFALTGLGEASIDNVSIRLVRRGNGQRLAEQARTYPALAPGLAPRRF